VRCNVPLTQSRFSHYIDPTLRAVLETSLTPDDNDLHLSNLVDTPILAVHGGSDENVPVWHSREAVSIIKTWASNSNISLREDSMKGHWYPDIFSNEEVQDFIESLLSAPQMFRKQSTLFTLTATAPENSGSMNGWKIEKLIVPGRVGRLRVHINNNVVQIITSNIYCFSLVGPLDGTPYSNLDIRIDNSNITHTQLGNRRFPLSFVRDDAKLWEVEVLPTTAVSEPPSRMQTILSSAAPIYFVVSGDLTSPSLSFATRVVHDLNLFHKLDAQIIFEEEASYSEDFNFAVGGNVVYVGNLTSSYIRKIIQKGKTPFKLEGSQLYLNGTPVVTFGKAILFVHPLPRSTGFMLFIICSDLLSYERARRLFPIRTGVTVPSWIIIGEQTDSVGAAGVEAAGVWGRDWTWSESLSWRF